MVEDGKTRPDDDTGSALAFDHVGSVASKAAMAYYDMIGSTGRDQHSPAFHRWFVGVWATGIKTSFFGQGIKMELDTL